MRKILIALLLVGSVFTGYALAADVVMSESDSPSAYDGTANVEIIGVEDAPYYVHGVSLICKTSTGSVENCAAELFDGDAITDTKLLAYRHAPTWATSKPIPEGAKVLFRNGITLKSYSDVETATVFYSPAKK